MLGYRRNRRGLLFGHRRRSLIYLLMTEQAEGFAAGPTKNEPSDHIPLTQWEDVYQKNRSELSALLLVYLFFGNDGKMSWSEHKRIKSFIKDEANAISDAIKNKIAGLIDHGITEEHIIDIIRENGYSEQIYDAALTSIKPLFHNDGKLFLMADRLKKKLKSEEIM